MAGAVVGSPDRGTNTALPRGSMSKPMCSLTRSEPACTPPPYPARNSYSPSRRTKVKSKTRALPGASSGWVERGRSPAPAVRRIRPDPAPAEHHILIPQQRLPRQQCGRRAVEGIERAEAVLGRHPVEQCRRQLAHVERPRLVGLICDGQSNPRTPGPFGKFGTPLARLV